MIITQTPLRISFVGGGSDFPDFYRKYSGAVVSSAIDKYIYVIVKERFDDEIVLNWRKKEIVKSLDSIEHELIREAMKKTGVKKGIEITTLADIPSEGAGLGSSSSVTVGLLQALYLYQGISVDAERLAQEACEIEIEILGKPMGKQDQYAAAYGGLNHFSFNKDDSVTITKIPLDNNHLHQLADYLMLIYTGQTRSSSSVLSQQRKNIEKSTDTLAKMVKQSYRVMAALEKGNWGSLGEAMDQGWRLKKQLSVGITNPKIERMYDLAKKAGAWGGKIAGAGGGGFLLLMVPSEKRQQVRKALAEFVELPFGLERDGSKVIFNIRRA